MDHAPSRSLESTLEELLEPALEAQGVELVELSISGNARRYVLRVFVDRPNGISIGECAGLSRELADLLDSHDPIEASYTLEVSSPGLTRPLKKQRDFERAIGKKIRLILKSGHQHKAVVRSVGDTSLCLDVDGESLDVPFGDITKANLHFEI